MREPAGARRAERSLGDGIGLSRPTPLFAPAGASAGAGAYNEERQTKRQIPRQWRLNHTGGIALVIFVLLFGAYALMTQHANRTSSREEPLHTVIGQVTPSRGSSVSANAAPLQEPPQPAASLTAPSTAPPVAQQQLPAPSNSSAAPLQEPPQPATSLPAPPAAPPIAQQPQAPAPSAKNYESTHVAQQPPAPAPTVKSHESAHVAQRSPAPAPSAKGHMPAPAVPQQRFADNRTDADARSAAAPSTHKPQDNDLTAPYLATARSDLDENNLAGARAALSKALDKAPANSDALMLRQDLASREHARDAALNKARACLEQHQWKCAWHSAGNALSIDSSSTEASALEQRSLVNWGETNQAEGQSPNTSP